MSEQFHPDFPDEVTDRVPRSLTWYPDDWFGGTLTLSHVEKACYFDLLMFQWQNGHMPTTDEERMQLMRLPECSYKVVWARLLKKLAVVYGSDVIDWKGDPEQRLIVQKRMHFDRNKQLMIYWKRITTHKNTEEKSKKRQRGHVTPHVTPHVGKGIRDKGKSKKEIVSPKLPYESAEYREAWDGYMEVRKQAKYTMTPRAIQLLIGKLGKMAEHDGIDALNAATLGKWKSVFLPVKSQELSEKEDAKRRRKKRIADQIRQREEIQARKAANRLQYGEE